MSSPAIPVRPPLGLQKIILGKENSIEDPDVLDKVRAAGYTALECGATNPESFRAMLDERGMRHAGAHVTPGKLADPSPLIDACGILGSNDISNSGLLDWNSRTLAGYRATADRLNEAGAKLRAAGIHLHYHNHDFEFEALPDAGNRTGMDILLEGLDPSAVDLCLDVGWVHRAGVDPITFLREHASRISYIHLKDYNDAGWIEHGRGVVPFDDIIAQLDQMHGIRWVVLEQDNTPGDPFESIRISREFFRNRFNW